MASCQCFSKSQGPKSLVLGEGGACVRIFTTYAVGALVQWKNHLSHQRSYSMPLS